MYGDFFSISRKFVYRKILKGNVHKLFFYNMKLRNVFIHGTCMTGL